KKENNSASTGQVNQSNDNMTSDLITDGEYCDEPQISNNDSSLESDSSSESNTSTPKSSFSENFSDSNSLKTISSSSSDSDVL
ncbi:1006_t:CDS:1, partial [Racocetra persica]